MKYKAVWRSRIMAVASLALVVGIASASSLVGNSNPNLSTAGFGASLPLSTLSTVWSADMETGNLTQWLQGGVSQSSYDSGNCLRPTNGVSTFYAHSGAYSMQQTIDLPPESGCRQLRSVESKTGADYYYSAWMLVPAPTRATNYWNVFQFKSNHCNTEEPFWVLDLMSRSTGAMYLRARYKGGNEELPGPHQGDTVGTKVYGQTIRDVVAGQWTRLEAFLHQSPSYTGTVTIWQDGVLIHDFQNVITKYPSGWAGCGTVGDQRWSINNYSDGLSPEPASIYYDDAAVSTTRLSAGPTDTPGPATLTPTVTNTRATTRTPTPSVTAAPPTATQTPVPASTSTTTPASTATASVGLPTSTATPDLGTTTITLTLDYRICTAPCSVHIVVVCPEKVTCTK